MSDAGKPQGGRLPAEGRQPAGRAGGPQDPHRDDRRRRDPRLDGARLRRQAGCHSRLRARHLVPCREGRRLLRPVRRAVRQGARLHADPREGAVAQADYTAWVDARKKEMAAAADDPSKTWDMPALVARGEAVYNANCAVCHRPDGKGAGPIKPLDGSAIVRDADKSKAARDRPQRRRRRRDARMEGQALGDRDRRRGHVHEECVVQQDRPDRPAGRSRPPPK